MVRTVTTVLQVVRTSPSCNPRFSLTAYLFKCNNQACNSYLCEDICSEVR